jgi:hypothetical protein
MAARCSDPGPYIQAAMSDRGVIVTRAHLVAWEVWGG